MRENSEARGPGLLHGAGEDQAGVEREAGAVAVAVAEKLPTIGIGEGDIRFAFRARLTCPVPGDHVQVHRHVLGSEVGIANHGAVMCSSAEHCSEGSFDRVFGNAMFLLDNDL